MSNYKPRVINYTPRLTDLEALELLPHPIRVVLWEAVTSWSAAWALRAYRKRIRAVAAVDFTLDDIEVNYDERAAISVVADIRAGDLQFCHKGFIPATGRRPKHPSTVEACGVYPLYETERGGCASKHNCQTRGQDMGQ